MKIKKVKCNGCAREFEEDKITFLTVKNIYATIVWLI